MAWNRPLFLEDNLPVLRGLDSESIDLIATDPPFNKGVGGNRRTRTICKSTARSRAPSTVWMRWTSSRCSATHATASSPTSSPSPSYAKPAFPSGT